MYVYDGKLFNEDLRNVDPYSIQITEEEKKMIILECKLSKSYFINAIVLKNRKESLLSKIYKKVTLEDYDDNT